MGQELIEPNGILKKLGKQRYLFVSLLMFLLIGSVTGAGDRPGAQLAMYGALAFVFVTGPIAASRSRLALYFTGFLAFCMFLLGLYSIAVDDMHPVAIGLGVVFFAFLAGLVLRDLLFVSDEVDEETLWMAVNVYLLIGLVFAFSYATIAFFDPSAFVGKFMDQPLRGQLNGFIYFSFVTLTTLGYGDLTPNNTFVGTLTYMEALIGQLYVAIMIARLVGLYIARRL
jgi:voltage-gated potassium channel